MYEKWVIILAGVVAVCGGFSSICVAVGWLVKIIRGVKKPSDDVKARFKATDEKLDNDNKRIKELEDRTATIMKAISLLLQDDIAILEHLRTNNATGKMAEQERKVQDFLIQRD